MVLVVSSDVTYKKVGKFETPYEDKKSEFLLSQKLLVAKSNLPKLDHDVWLFLFLLVSFLFIFISGSDWLFAGMNQSEP